MRISHQGVGAARNAALASARGEIIAYLDDDNVMDPEWLFSVAWAFEQHPETDVLYGAFVVDDLLRVNSESSGQLPRTFLHPWNREALRKANFADIGAIAHRSGLAEARFDETLMQMGDWDLLLKLTEERDPLMLPAIACYYMTDAPNRLTLGPTQAADYAAVAARAARIAE
jgi:glycosyltransferase involved in cell wall biosynthesis